MAVAQFFLLPSYGSMLRSEGSVSIKALGGTGVSHFRDWFNGSRKPYLYLPVISGLRIYILITGVLLEEPGHY